MFRVFVQGKTELEVQSPIGAANLDQSIYMKVNG